MLCSPPPQDLPPGIDVHGSLIVEYGSVLDGGLRRSDAGRSLAGLEVTFDLELLAGLTNTWLVAIGESLGGDPLSADVGDVQIQSNIEFDESRDQLSAFYVQHEDELAGWTGAVGKLDANSWFSVADHLGTVMHSSAGFSPSLVDFPSYPDPALGGVLFAQVSERVRVGAGVFEEGASFEGPVGYLQGEWRGAEASSRLVLGGFWHGGDLPASGGGAPTERGHGLFALAEQRLAAGAERETWLTAQLAWSERETSDLHLHAALGLVFEGLPNVRPDDVISLYASHVESATDERAELALEAAWHLSLSRHLSLQPALAWVQNPLADPAAEDATVFLVRLIGHF